MDDINVIDQFMQTFIDYIDTGFGFLAGEVFFLTTVIITIDIVLAGLFWAFDQNRDIIQSLIVKVLYVGFFALILNNFPFFTNIIFESFGGLGIEAVNSEETMLDSESLLRPGFIASVGLQAAHPIMEEVRSSLGSVGMFSNWDSAIIGLGLLFPWAMVLLAFFILAIQLFVTIIEFKLTTLAGFALVPFALWKKSSFLAERVLGNIISCGIKLMVLAVVIGIGSTLFGAFTDNNSGDPIELENALVIMLAALTLVGLAIFTPGIAAGLVSGAPQLGAGAAVGTALGVGLATAGAARLAAGGAGATWNAGKGAVAAGAKVSGAAATAFGLGRATSGASGLGGVAAGVGGVAQAGASAAANAAAGPFRRAAGGVAGQANQGAHGAWAATGGAPLRAAPGNVSSAGASREPNWAAKLRRDQDTRDATRTAAHTIRDGDRPGAGANPSLKEED